MPAPRPSITAMVVAKSGMPIGLDTAARISWLMNTPTSAPISVTNIAASDRNRIVSRMIAMPTPISSPTGACCWEARSTLSPRRATERPSPSAVRAAFSSSLPSSGSSSVDWRS